MDKSYNIFKIKTLLLFIILIYISLNLIFLSEEYLEDGQLIVIEVTLLFLSEEYLEDGQLIVIEVTLLFLLIVK